MNSETFQRVMDGYADTPQERVLAEMLQRNPTMFFHKWQETWEAEQQPVEVMNWPTQQREMIDVAPKPQSMSKKARKLLETQAPDGYLLCWKCNQFKRDSDFSLDHRLEHRRYHRHYCHDCDRTWKSAN